MTATLLASENGTSLLITAGLMTAAMIGNGVARLVTRRRAARRD